ncbi:FAD-dependent oxidoreductase [Sporosarcina cascadiensis]|uniref:FAD-dependent oxidoreductase n=1 Tax=Sporosarcina cascadiensis TaxID=2660747 RepID=UPI00129B5328|nr:FAD-dependent oxidoreductase [Sporosarcina cascadiensis]
MDNLQVENRSYWKASTHAVSYLKLAKDEAADVAVIGGGISGILTAYYLAKEGLSVVLLFSLGTSGMARSAAGMARLEYSFARHSMSKVRCRAFLARFVQTLVRYDVTLARFVKLPILSPLKTSDQTTSEVCTFHYLNFTFGRLSLCSAF